MKTPHTILALVALLLGCAATHGQTKPNIVYILCDDLGYGDVQALNPARGKIATPHLDRFVKQGLSFTDAHSGSSVCTPTRYGILTGRYCWRTRLQRGVLHGFSAPLIAAERLTVPALLKKSGYQTACIGKWHLGMTVAKDASSREVRNGPTTRGFDSFFGVSASADMPVFGFIDGDRYTALPTAKKKWLREGPAVPGFDVVDLLPTLTRKAVTFITEAKSPFFLYLALTSPHTPIVPTKEWQGRSSLNRYADFVMQTDASIGQVLDALDKSGHAADTLVIFTSDNGCSPAAGLAVLEGNGHYPSADRRGCKADIFDGGHRIPFIARWPGKITAGSTTDQLICLTDLMATCADILGAKLPANAGEDSVSLLPVLLGTAKAPIREAVVHHSINGSFAIRQGKWKLELCRDSGGWSAPKPGSPAAQGLPPVQLYDMSQDVGERANEFKKHPDVVAQLTKLLEKYVTEGRSTPGTPQSNDGPINLHAKVVSSEPVGDAISPE